MCEQMRENARRFLKKITWPIESVQSHSFSFDWKTHQRGLFEISNSLPRALFAFRFPPFFPLSFLFFFFALFLVFFFFIFFKKDTNANFFSFVCSHLIQHLSSSSSGDED